MTNKIKLVVVCIGTLGCFSVFSQADSVKMVVASNVQIDSTAMNAEAQKAYNEGISAFQSKNYAEAITQFSKAIEIEPAFIQAHTNLANVYLANKQNDLAEATLLKITELSDTVHSPFFQLGQLAEAKDSLLQAVHYYSKAIERQPKEVKYLYQRGIQYFKLTKYDEAIADFSKSIQLNPNNADAYNDRGSAYKMKGDLTKAAADYLQASKYGKSSIAFNNLGNTYREQKQYKKAITTFDQAIQFNANDKLLWNNRGYAKFEDENFKGAIDDFKKVNEIDPAYAPAYNNAAGAYIELENFNKALEMSNKAIEKDANLGSAYFNRAIANEMLRKDTNACMDWSKAADLGIQVAESYYSRNGCNELMEEK
jgi:tetratricopeptide (TPR) repeat protein